MTQLLTYIQSHVLVDSTNGIEYMSPLRRYQVGSSGKGKPINIKHKALVQSMQARCCDEDACRVTRNAVDCTALTL